MSRVSNHEKLGSIQIVIRIHHWSRKDLLIVEFFKFEAYYRKIIRYQEDDIPAVRPYNVDNNLDNVSFHVAGDGEEVDPEALTISINRMVLEEEEEEDSYSSDNDMEVDD